MHKIIFSLICLLGLNISSMADEVKQCQTIYRPFANEIAFAAVGASLKVSDIACVQSALQVPYDQKINAVFIPKGEYLGTKKENNLLFFTLKNQEGDMIKSCPWCDGLTDVIFDAKENTLCVSSILKVRSCALKNGPKFNIIQKETLDENVCTPSLVYYGISNKTMRFAINDCKKISAPSLSYDLTLGRKIRFLNETFEIIDANNEGVVYRLLPLKSRN